MLRATSCNFAIRRWAVTTATAASSSCFPFRYTNNSNLHEQQPREQFRQFSASFRPPQQTPPPPQQQQTPPQQQPPQQQSDDSTGESVSSTSTFSSSKPHQPHERHPPTAPFPHPEELIDAVVEFVHRAKEPPPADESIPMLGKEEEQAIARLDSVLFYEGFVPDTEKYRVVRALVYFPSIRKNKKYLLPAVHRILSLLVPDQIFQVLQEVDLDEKEKFQEREAMEMIEEFFGTILEGRETDEEVSRRFQELQKKVKAIGTLDSFKKFVVAIDKLIAEGQTAAAITDACLEFDPQGWGRIKAFEMRLALQKALPLENFKTAGESDSSEASAGDEDAAALKDIVIDEIMLDVAAQTEEDGYVAYQHLRKL